VRKRRNAKRRSECPLNASVEMLGDRWSLLIIRDMMLQGARTYKAFMKSDGRKLIYRLTAKGIDLAPVLTEMVLWAAAHEDTGNQALVRQMREDKEKFMAGVRQRWVSSPSHRT
jgi:DNA-binding HxlR family transcriptional regulator